MAPLGWQMAKEWLRATGVVPPTSKIHMHTCDLFDFAHSLRDGVILCQVANYLVEGAVRDVNLATHMSQFLCMKNIRGFLKACTTVFGISNDDLFTANDLYDVSDFQKVIHTLSLLSKTSQALRFGLESFPPENQQNGAEDDSEGIYSSLPDVIREKKDIEEEEMIYDHVSIQESEKIYEDIVEIKRSRASQSSHIDDKRSHVINEILQTEENYYNALKVMIECFIQPLKQLLTPEEKNAIFINTETLYQFHGEFLRALRPTGKTIDILSFVKYKMRFLEYGFYCARVREAQEYVTEKSKMPAFSAKVEECKAISRRKFPLQEQLIVPFQRILKYPLLLKELRKQTPAEHKEREQVDKALIAMEDVGQYVNMYKRDDEEKTAIYSIANSVHDDVGGAHYKIHEFGRRVRDGEVTVRFSNNEKKNCKRFAFLFETTMLLCKTRGDTYIVKENLPLKKFKLEGELPSTVKGIRSQLAWSLEAREPDGATEANNCTMIAKSAQEKEKWVDGISRCIDMVTLSKVKKTENHMFELTTFTSGKNCAVCDLLLRGQISQGYKCENCQKAVHYDCIEKCGQCVKKSRGTRYEQTRISGKGSPVPSQKTANIGELQKLLKKYAWFAGELVRGEAEDLLKAEPDGTFLVRASTNKNQFVLSVKYRSNIKHIVIEVQADKYFLTEAKKFFAIHELINYYKHNSLKESFPTLPTTLVRTVSSSNEAQLFVRALFPYSSNSPEELTLVRGDVIRVNKSDGNWWYGECNGQAGYFPSNYVEQFTGVPN